MHIRIHAYTYTCINAYRHISIYIYIQTIWLAYTYTCINVYSIHMVGIYVDMHIRIHA